MERELVPYTQMFMAGWTQIQSIKLKIWPPKINNDHIFDKVQIYSYILEI